MNGTSVGSRPLPKRSPLPRSQKEQSLVTKLYKYQHFLNSAAPAQNLAGRQHSTSRPRSFKNISTTLAGRHQENHFYEGKVNYILFSTTLAGRHQENHFYVLQVNYIFFSTTLAGRVKFNQIS